MMKVSVHHFEWLQAHPLLAVSLAVELLEQGLDIGCVDGPWLGSAAEVTQGHYQAENKLPVSGARKMAEQR